MKIIKEADSKNFDRIFSKLVREIRYLIRASKKSVHEIVFKFLKKSAYQKDTRHYQKEIEKNYLDRKFVEDLVTCWWPHGFFSLMIVCEHFDTDIVNRVKDIIVTELKVKETLRFVEKPERKEHFMNAIEDIGDQDFKSQVLQSFEKAERDLQFKKSAPQMKNLFKRAIHSTNENCPTEEKKQTSNGCDTQTKISKIIRGNSTTSKSASKSKELNKQNEMKTCDTVSEVGPNDQRSRKDFIENKVEEKLNIPQSIPNQSNSLEQSSIMEKDSDDIDRIEGYIVQSDQIVFRERGRGLFHRFANVTIFESMGTENFKKKG